MAIHSNFWFYEPLREDPTLPAAGGIPPMSTSDTIALWIVVGLCIGAVIIVMKWIEHRSLSERQWPNLKLKIEKYDWITALGLCAAFAVLIALADLPYNFYLVLRVFICGACAVLLVRFRTDSLRVGWLVAAAILFNPLFPIHLTKEIWRFVNVVATFMFVWLVAG